MVKERSDAKAYGSTPKKSLALRQKIKGIAFAMPCFSLCDFKQGIRTRTVGFADENSPVDCLKVRG